MWEECAWARAQQCSPLAWPRLILSPSRLKRGGMNTALLAPAPPHEGVLHPRHPNHRRARGRFPTLQVGQSTSTVQVRRHMGKCQPPTREASERERLAGVNPGRGEPHPQPQGSRLGEGRAGRWCIGTRSGTQRCGSLRFACISCSDKTPCVPSLPLGGVFCPCVRGWGGGAASQGVTEMHGLSLSREPPYPSYDASCRCAGGGQRGLSPEFVGRCSHQVK